MLHIPGGRGNCGCIRGEDNHNRKALRVVDIQQLKQQLQRTDKS